MARFILTIINNTGAAINGNAPGVPSTWINNFTTSIANGGTGTVNIDVPTPAPGGSPPTAILRYTQAAGGTWQLLMTNPGTRGTPNASGSYTPPLADHAVAIAPGLCPLGSPAISICYNVTFT